MTVLLRQKKQNVSLNAKNKSSFNRSQYIKKVHMYNEICVKAKSDFLKSRIHDNQDNPQKLWQTLNNVLHRSAAKVLPSVNSPKLLANKFVEFFTEKSQTFVNPSPTLIPLNTRTVISHLLFSQLFPLFQKIR